MKKILLLTIFPVSLIIISCQREPDVILEQVQQNCRIDSGIYYGGSGMVNDSSYFTYSSGRLTRVEAFDSYVNYTYAGDHISTRRWYEKPGDRLFEIDSVHYNSQNDIATLVTWYYDHPIYWDTTRVRYDFIYNGGRLGEVVESAILFSQLGNQYDTMRTVFTYDGFGNIVKLEGFEWDGTPIDEMIYTYNADPNYFSAIHPDFFLFEPYFQLHAGFLPHLPYFYSANNVVSFDPYGGIPYDVTYGVDSLDNVTSVDVDGSEYMKYKFRCN